MIKIRSNQLNYQGLLLTTIKKRALSLALGGVVILVISIAVVSLLFQKITSQSEKISPEDEQKTKAKVTSINKVRTYVVKEGDQLYLIAQKLYGSGLNMEDIMKTNKITNPDLLEVGQKLIIPDVKPRSPTVGIITESAAKTEKVTVKSDKYTVKEGDNLVKIALQTYGDSYAWKRIADANAITNSDQLEVGKILIIPR